MNTKKYSDIIAEIAAKRSAEEQKVRDQDIAKEESERQQRLERLRPLLDVMRQAGEAYTDKLCLRYMDCNKGSKPDISPLSLNTTLWSTVVIDDTRYTRYSPSSGEPRISLVEYERFKPYYNQEISIHTQPLSKINDLIPQLVSFIADMIRQRV